MVSITLGKHGNKFKRVDEANVGKSMIIQLVRKGQGSGSSNSSSRTAAKQQQKSNRKAAAEQLVD